MLTSLDIRLNTDLRHPHKQASSTTRQPRTSGGQIVCHWLSAAGVNPIANNYYLEIQGPGRSRVVVSNCNWR